MNAKTGILVFGTLLGALSASAALPVANPAVHFDASDASTLTLDEGGFVTNWLAATTGATAATAPTKTSEGFDNAVPFLTEENGRKAVVFGKDQQGNTAYTLMALVSNQNKLKTVFIVSRQHEATASGACPIWGDIATAGCAISRTKSADCVWGDTLVDSSTFWVNGLLGNSFANCGGADAPHVMAVRTDAFDSKNAWAKLLGGGYVQNSSGVQRPAGYFRGSLHEVVAYLDKLTDEQILATQQYLMEKWGIDGLCVWTGAKDQNWNDGDNWACGRVPDNDAKTIRLGGAAVVAQGALTLPATALVDLGGGSLTVAGLTGGVVTNSAQTVATLTVNAATDAELGAKVSGNVNFVKNGSGVLKVASGQTYAGTTTLNGGTLQAVQPSSFDWNKYSGMVFRLDASEVGTVETETGASNVTKWASLTDNGYSFRPLKDVPDFADKYAYAKGESLLTTDADGRPCVRFGSQVDDATSLGSALCPFDDKDAYKSLTVATVFFVNRQHVATLTSGRQCGLFGQAGPSSDRVYRTVGDCVWTGSRLYTVWTSGKKQYDLANPQLEGDIEFASSSGAAGPHVLSVVRSSKEDATGVPQARTLNIIGAAYMDKEDTTAKSRCGQFDLYEAIGFSRVLTEEEIKEITDHLIVKWGVKTRTDVVVDRPANTLSPNTSYAVTAPTVMDFGWMDQTFGDLSFATESASYPLLTFARTLSSVCIDGKTLTLSHPADVTVKKSDILCGNAGISGEFAAVTGGKVWYAGEEKDRTVRAGDERGMVILLK